MNMLQRARVERSIERLRGFVCGIACDQIINDLEIAKLEDWRAEFADLCKRQPFKELGQLMHRILADGVVDHDEREEILEWCQFFSDSLDNPISDLTSGTNRLHGMLAGLVADNVVTAVESMDFADWLRDHERFREQWPWSEVWQLIELIAEDGEITADDLKRLEEFCRCFVAPMAPLAHVHDDDYFPNKQPLGPILVSIDGIYDPIDIIVFRERSFCFTGNAQFGKRRELEAMVYDLGGAAHTNVTIDLNYLVVGALSSPAWAYAPYGRKIEKVFTNRSNGAETLIIHESTFLQQVHRAMS